VDINEAFARLDIQNVLWTYARGVDRGDLDALRVVDAYSFFAERSNDRVEAQQ
jgi:hypothetical protein